MYAREAPVQALAMVSSSRSCAAKQPRVALWAWMVWTSGFSNNLRMAGVRLAGLGDQRVGHHPGRIEAAQRQHAVANTGGT